MMNYGKYIIVDGGSFKQPILFDNTIAHSEFTDMYPNPDYILSAGFFAVGAKPSENDPDDIDVSVFGESVSLKLKSNPEDARHIKRILRKEW